MYNVCVITCVITFLHMVRHVGFTVMDSTVLRAMEIWLIRALEKQIVATSEAPEKQADFQSALGTLFKEIGRYEESAALFEACLVSRKRVLGEKNPSVTHEMNFLAITYKHQGRYEEARALLNASLKTEQGDDIMHMANLGNCCFDEGQYDEAASIFEAVLETMKQRGEEDPDTLGAMSNLACAYRGQGLCEKQVGV